MVEGQKAAALVLLSGLDDGAGDRAGGVDRRQRAATGSVGGALTGAALPRFLDQKSRLFDLSCRGNLGQQRIC